MVAAGAAVAIARLGIRRAGGTPAHSQFISATIGGKPKANKGGGDWKALLGQVSGNCAGSSD
jgi:hypothetical protein